MAALKAIRVTQVKCTRCGSHQKLPVAINDTRECDCPAYVVPLWEITHKTIIVPDEQELDRKRPNCSVVSTS